MSNVTTVILEHFAVIQVTRDSNGCEEYEWLGERHWPARISNAFVEAGRLERLPWRLAKIGVSLNGYDSFYVRLD